MLDLYRSGDPYLNFGKIIGLIPPDATRETPGVEVIRDRIKVLCLGTQYGMQRSTLAIRLGVSEIEAHEMLQLHRGLFSQYWHWSEDWLHHSLNTGTMRTILGWQCATGISEFSERSIRNWPIQSICADIFRIAYVWGTRHGLTLIAPVHDAVLLEAPEDRIEADVALASTASGSHRQEGQLMQDEPWYVQRRRELEAAAPVKRKAKKWQHRFVSVPWV